MHARHQIDNSLQSFVKHAALNVGGCEVTFEYFDGHLVVRVVARQHFAEGSLTQ